MPDEPLAPDDARRRILALVSSGCVRFSRHALERIAARELDMADCLNVLRGGIVGAGEWEHGSWRYPVCTPRGYTVVVAFRGETLLVVVTAWAGEP